MKTPLVSVVVATYRRDTPLKTALVSLANQTYTNIEIILVDDNGDRSWNEKVSDIVKSFRAERPQIPFQLIVNSPNQGSAETRNIGIRASKGEYVTFLDDDDVYLPEKIRSQVEYMLSENCDYSVTDLALYNEQDKLVEMRTRDYVKGASRQELFRYHLMHHLTGTDTMMFRKSYLEQIGGFAPINVGDEFYLMQRAIEGGGKFGYLDRCEVKAYVHSGEGGLSSGWSKIEGENQLYEYKKQYYPELDRKTIRYIRMRHYAVLAFAYLRQKDILRFVATGARSFLASPMQCVSLLMNLK